MSTQSSSSLSSWFEVPSSVTTSSQQPPAAVQSNYYDINEPNNREQINAIILELLKENLDRFNISTQSPSTTTSTSTTTTTPSTTSTTSTTTTTLPPQSSSTSTTQMPSLSLNTETPPTFAAIVQPFRIIVPDEMEIDEVKHVDDHNN